MSVAKYHNFIKFKLLELAVNETNGGNTVVDFGIGMGGDLHKWNKLNMETVNGCDISENSLGECVQRYQQSQYKFRMNIEVKDLRTELYTAKQKSAIATSFFAIHYNFEKEEHLNNFFRNVNINLKPDGILIITFLNGNKLNNAFQKHGDYIDNTIALARKFYRKPYNYGARIQFTMKTTYFNKKGRSNEFLVNPDIITEKAKLFGLVKVKEISFQEYLTEFDDHLSSEEIGVSSLHTALIFRLVIPK